MEKIVGGIHSQLSEFIELHDLVRDNMKILKYSYYKDKKKALEALIIKSLTLHDQSIVDINNKRIYYFKNPDRLTIYHPRILKDVEGYKSIAYGAN